MPAEDKPMSAEDDILRRQFRELYPVHAIIRKSLGEMMRKLSVTSSQ